MKKVLTIAGSDCSGGAGIQSDIKTMTAHNVYAMSAIVALTAQNTTGVYGIMDVSKEFLENQLDCVFSDIYPDAIKIGMVSNKDSIEVIAKKLIEVGAKNIVLDPVMVATSGSKLLSDDARQCLIDLLMPLSDIVTPNMGEASMLSGVYINSPESMIIAAKKIAEETKGAVLIKGGHLDNSANDLLYHNGEITWFEEEKIITNNTHGTGCTLSSAIASNLALGYDLKLSVLKAKEYLTGALKYNLNLGKGNGPLNHCYKGM